MRGQHTRPRNGGAKALHARVAQRALQHVISLFSFGRETGGVCGRTRSVRFSFHSGRDYGIAGEAATSRSPHGKRSDISVCIFSGIHIVYNYDKWPINVDQSYIFPYIEKGSNYFIKEFPNEKTYQNSKEKIEEL